MRAPSREGGVVFSTGSIFVLVVLVMRDDRIPTSGTGREREREGGGGEGGRERERERERFIGYTLNTQDQQMTTVGRHAKIRRIRLNKMNKPGRHKLDRHNYILSSRRSMQG